METPSPFWPGILQSILKAPLERQRLSSTLGVTTMTLSRWASGESNPQKAHLISLVKAVQPHYRSPLLSALEQAYPDIHSWLQDEAVEQIPSAFFSHVLQLRTTTTESLRFWRISEAVLKQALSQLDPHRFGMAVKLVQCMPPSSSTGKVHSLRERTGKGNPPWTPDLEHDVLFLGLESMCGYAVEKRHALSDGDLRTIKATLSFQDDYEISAAVQPVRFEERIAGCLLASSTQVKYFTPQRLALLATFSDLISLAFDKEEFYPPSMIELRVLPPPSAQRPIIANFRRRVTARFQESIAQQHAVNNHTIEQQAWQEIEHELLTMQLDTPDANLSSQPS